MNSTKNDSSTPPALSVAGNFVAMLQGKSSGVTLAQLDHELAQLVLTVQQNRRPGSLTYKIKISPNGKGIKLEDDVAIKEPKAETGVSHLFVGEGGVLLRNDPNQLNLPLRSVDSGETQGANLKTA